MMTRPIALNDPNRVRMPIACVLCRGFKTRCDGEPPLEAATTIYEASAEGNRRKRRSRCGDNNADEDGKDESGPSTSSALTSASLSSATKDAIINTQFSSSMDGIGRRTVPSSDSDPVWIAKDGDGKACKKCLRAGKPCEWVINRRLAIGIVRRTGKSKPSKARTRSRSDDGNGTPTGKTFKGKGKGKGKTKERETEPLESTSSSACSISASSSSSPFSSSILSASSSEAEEMGGGVKEEDPRQIEWNLSSHQQQDREVPSTGSSHGSSAYSSSSRSSPQSFFTSAVSNSYGRDEPHIAPMQFSSVLPPPVTVLDEAPSSSNGTMMMMTMTEEVGSGTGTSEDETVLASSLLESLEVFSKPPPSLGVAPLMEDSVLWDRLRFYRYLRETQKS